VGVDIGQNMKRMGNAESNRTYNPRNAKPQIPIDIDEVDSAMERYIRQKYEQRIYMNDTRPGTRQNTGSTSSDDRPPPLPPKPTGRFGFGLRKAATSPRNLTPPVSPGLGSFGQETSPPRVNKPSRVFGSNIQTSGDGLDSKLATLRDMGFPDDKRNSTVLKGLNGNLDRTVEALIRLGEQNAGRSRGNTPTPPAKPSTNGLSFDRTNTAPAATSSTNPFDALDAVAAPSYPAQQQQPTSSQPSYDASFAQTAQPSNSYNPFLAQTQQMQYQQPQSIPQQQQQQIYNYQHNPFGQPQSLEQSMQNMQLSQQQQPQQPLFPNRTGGYGPTSPPFAQTNPFQQSFTPPPMPQIPEQYSSFFAPQSQYQPMSSPSSPGNPFLKSSRSQMFSPPSAVGSNPFGQPSGQQQAQPPQATNPYMMTQQTQAPTVQGSNPWQSQQPGMFQQQNTQQPSYQQQQSFQQQQPQQNFQQQNYQQPGFQQYQQQPGNQQNANPFDKNSILALYNYPQLAPQPSESSQAPSVQTSTLPPAAPASGHMNPFASSQNTAQGQPLSAAQTPGVRHVSNESVDFSGLMGGRHSPDAFSGLSASFKR
jgi:hypothetical protein